MAGFFEYSTAMKLFMLIMVFIIMVLGIFVFLSSILYCYMLQKFYIDGQPLLNNQNGRTLYAAVVAMMISLAGAVCSNNRSVVSVQFLLFFVVSGIVALSHIQKIKKHAYLYVLTPDGMLQRQDLPLGQMKLTAIFSWITGSAVIISGFVWLFGMMLAFSMDSVPASVKDFYGGFGKAQAGNYF